MTFLDQVSFPATAVTSICESAFAETSMTFGIVATKSFAITPVFFGDGGIDLVLVADRLDFFLGIGRHFGRSLAVVNASAVGPAIPLVIAFATAIDAAIVFDGEMVIGPAADGRMVVNVILEFVEVERNGVQAAQAVILVLDQAFEVLVVEPFAVDFLFPVQIVFFILDDFVLSDDALSGFVNDARIQLARL